MTIASNDDGDIGTYRGHLITGTRGHVFNQLSVEVQQDQGIRMRIALGGYIIADGVPGGVPHCRNLPGTPDLDRRSGHELGLEDGE